MSGFQPIRLRPGSGAAPRPPALGALRVPDFDAPAADPAMAAVAAARAARAAARAAALRKARAAGQAAGERAGHAAAVAERDAAIGAALSMIAERIGDAAAAAEAAADAAATEGAAVLAGLLLAALEAALPAAAARLGPETAALLATRLKPVLAEVPALTLFVAAGLGPACAARIGDPRVLVAEDAALAAGDARAEWRHGQAVVALAEQWRAVECTLAAFGLGGD